MTFRTIPNTLGPMVSYTRSRGPGFWELKTCVGQAHSHRPHSHAEWSLGLVTGGACLVGCGGRTVPLTAPSLVWFSPEIVHDCRPLDTDDWAFRMLYWPQEGAPGSWGVKPLDAGEVETWERFFAHLEGGETRPAPAFPWEVPGAVFPPAAAPLSGRPLSRPDRPYKRLHGLPPSQHRTILRLRRAQVLLRQGWAPAAVALEAGFYDQSQFTRAFRDLTGTTPGRYA